MLFRSKLEAAIKNMYAGTHESSEAVDRICGQMEFASRFTELHPENRAVWQSLILQTGELVIDRLPTTAPVDLPRLVAEAEGILAPIGAVAKAYTIHCCGHAHIDMNWTWPLVETIATAHDTFITLDRLMDIFPDLKFGQSQISIYKMMKDYCPEVWEIIQRRINDGLWQVTAGSWTEGDKNMASGESLCRHILCSKRWLRENLGLSYDTVNIDWMPDTFGHPWSLPSILSLGGIRRYYFSRPNSGPWLNRWQSPDGSRVLAFRDKGTYNGEITSKLLTPHFMDYVQETGLKDFLWVYGVGNHGGGVTLGHLVNARKLDSWSVFPNVKLSTIDSFFDSVEPFAERMPINDSDFNTIFEGCYTSQSRIKKLNRLAEMIIPEAETISTFAAAAVGFDYQADQLQIAWEHALFNQFHDILAGSSGHAAMEEAEIRFQQIEGITGSIKMRALRKIASQINTASACGVEPLAADSVDSYALNFGRGAGDVRVAGRISTWSMGTRDVEPIVVFNSLPYSRSEMAVTKIWGRDWPADRLVVVDDVGNETPGQVIGQSRSSCGHKSLNVLFSACNIPAMGYRTFCVKTNSESGKTLGLSVASPYIIENDFLRVEIDPPTGAIKHLIEKNTGFDWVPKGELLCLLELYQEAPHSMTAWDIGQITDKFPLSNGMTIDESDLRDSREGDSLGMVFTIRQPQSGPQRIACRTLHLVNGSRVRLEIAINSISASVEIGVSLEWKELGSPETGIPMLRMALPLNISEPKFTTEIPFGSMERPNDGKEFPAQRWVDLSDAERGATLVNDCKYGFSAEGNVIRATLIRSTYDPDAYPEMGSHEMQFILTPHSGPCNPTAAIRQAESLNQPMSVVGTGIHDGLLPANASWAEVLTPGISLSALKKAEDSDAIVVRMYETAGQDTEARVRLDGIVKPGARCTNVDILEQPLAESHTWMDGNVLVAKLPAHGIVTVKIEAG